MASIRLLMSKTRLFFGHEFYKSPLPAILISLASDMDAISFPIPVHFWRKIRNFNSAAEEKKYKAKLTPCSFREYTPFPITPVI